MSDKILWSEKSKLRPNIWGLGYGGGYLSVSPFSAHTDYNRVSPLATLVVSIIFLPVIGLVVGAILGKIMGIIFVIGCLAFLIYWFFLREIKYYQLTKNMKYELTESDCIFSYKYFGIVSIKKIPITNISTVHLVEFKKNDLETGSIYLYQEDKFKAFNLYRKERTNQAIIERVENYEEFLSIINRLMKESW